MTVPAAAISVLDLALVGRRRARRRATSPRCPTTSRASTPPPRWSCCPSWSSTWASASPAARCEEEARELRTRLDAAAAADAQTHAYVERLEGMVDEARLPSGTELISDIERFLRDRGAETDTRG